MRSLIILLSLLSVSLALLSTEKHFHGHSVLKYHLTTKDQIDIVQKLGVDVWSYDSIPIIGVNDIMVSQEEKKILARHGIHHQGVMIHDVEQHLQEERDTINALETQGTATWFESYHTLDDIWTFYRNLSTTYPQLARFHENIGESVEKRPIHGFSIGNKDATKKIYIEGGQHAREWVSISTVAYIKDQLLHLYERDPAVKQILDNILIVAIPVVNVDGYTFTWTSNRLWRKNRKQNTGGSFGVDLNRNWDDHWGGEGSSGSPTSDTYHGTAPFSEPESKAASEFYLANGPYGGAIDYHSYSQLILRPYGWSTALPPNDAAAKSVGDGIRDTIRATTGVVYTSEPSWQLYYTSGTAQDWFYSKGKAPLAYTIELRDTGNYGFQLPPAQIIPTGEENLRGFLTFAAYILKN